MSKIGIIGDAFAGILQGFDGLFTSDEERLQAKTQVMAVQVSPGIQESIPG